MQGSAGHSSNLMINATLSLFSGRNAFLKVCNQIERRAVCLVLESRFKHYKGPREISSCQLVDQSLTTTMS